MEIWSTLQSHYNYLFTEIRDPRYCLHHHHYPPDPDVVRVDSWFLMSSPWPTAALCLLYYYVIRIAGPR